MRIDPEELDYFAREAIEALPVLFTWKGSNYHGSMGQKLDQSILQMGGWHEGLQLEFVVRKRDLPDPKPAQHELFTIDGKDYELIDNGATSYHDPHITFQLRAKP